MLRRIRRRDLIPRLKPTFGSAAKIFSPHNFTGYTDSRFGITLLVANEYGIVARP